MLFNSLVFIGFFVIIMTIYPFLQHKVQNVFLLIASYLFYGYWDWRFNFLLLTLTIVNFWIGKCIYESNNEIRRKRMLALSVSVSLIILGFFKYFNFFLDTASILLSAVGFKANLPLLRVILPVGISFFTFQTMSYTIDIYRRKLDATKNFIDFALFVAFFPQLVAGPIERAANLLPQIAKPRKMTQEKILSGLNLVLLGYFKKVAIADTLAPIVEKAFSSPGEVAIGLLWTGLYAFAIQIYGDFSGYTDIARGIARLMGFELMINFNAPYLSRNITEFWSRWHISLSTWLRDYLYIPLGGNRLGKRRTYINLMVTMLLGGLWHGAAWNFVFWGLLHGIYLAVHRMLVRDDNTSILHIKSNILGGITGIFKAVFTFHLIALTWVFFRSPDLSMSFSFLQGLFQFDTFNGISSAVMFAGFLVLLLDLAQTWTGSHTWLVDRHSALLVRYSVIQLMFVSVLVAAIAHVQTVTPFIYFAF